MDAVKFIKERDRMCRFYHHAWDCYQCPAKDCECSALEGMVDDDNIVTIVEKWSATHPPKTRQSLFLEQWPEAAVDENGVPEITPCSLLKLYRKAEWLEGKCGALEKGCSDCRREFWMQEVE
nr:MAG TPA: hypothetical protein [Caudoviricetes sp.]